MYITSIQMVPINTPKFRCPQLQRSSIQDVPII